MSLTAEESVTIAAPPETVWRALSAFHDMSWLPPVDRTEGTGGNSIGAARRLHLKGGPTVDEVLERYEPEAMSYSYRIAAVDTAVLPVTVYSSTIAVQPGSSGSSVVSWRGSFSRGQPGDNPPAALNDEAAVKAVSGLYRTGLDALKARVEGASA
jgi:uncharacterized protein YndB with AHSA1/START domain